MILGISREIVDLKDSAAIVLTICFEKTNDSPNTKKWFNVIKNGLSDRIGKWVKF